METTSDHLVVMPPGLHGTWIGVSAKRYVRIRQHKNISIHHATLEKAEPSSQTLSLGKEHVHNL
jgi:hypothetical protein